MLALSTNSNEGFYNLCILYIYVSVRRNRKYNRIGAGFVLLLFDGYSRTSSLIIDNEPALSLCQSITKAGALFLLS